MPLNTSNMWEDSLKKLEAEVLEADRTLAPNRFALRAEWLAKRMSYAQTQELVLQAQNSVALQGSYDRYRNLVGVPTASTQVGSIIPVAEKDDISPLSTARDYTYGINHGIAALPSLSRTVQSIPNQDSNKVASMDEQKFIQRIGMLSNCNVNVQEKPLIKGEGFRTNLKQHRLYCDVCQQASPVNSAVVVYRNASDPELQEFCKRHRHDHIPSAEELDGRVFKGDL